MAKVKKGSQLKIRKDSCKGCGLCISFCPEKALRLSKDYNLKGSHYVEWIGDCKFCGMCYVVCPDYVIEIE